METHKIINILDRVEKYYNERFADEGGYQFTVSLELFSDESGSVRLFTIDPDRTKKTGYSFYDNEAELFSFSDFEEFIENFLDWVIEITKV